ncbi:MAG: hypothetical protein C4K48_11500 [Candidatus Thorarchaeota archaeon]|nr:MAG: hypothetical protein C4K48_11500 [Candidatus Thorarchaeota archaeon]
MLLRTSLYIERGPFNSFVQDSAWLLLADCAYGCSSSSTFSKALQVKRPADDWRVLKPGRNGTQCK